MNSNTLFLLCFTVAAVLSSGCTSLESTAISRTQDDRAYVDSPCHLKGVPTALQVPTHLDVWVKETYFLQKTPRGWEEAKFDRRNLGIETNIVKTKKIFAVDFKRPLAGTNKIALGFNNEQYLSTLENQIVDETIQDVTGILGQFQPTEAVATSAKNAAPKLDDTVIENQRHVAYRRFDIDDPNFEASLSAFLDEQMNNCHSCGVSTTYASNEGGYTIAQPAFESVSSRENANVDHN